MADATALAYLDTSIRNLTIRIAEVSACANPDYSIDGQSVSKGTYLGQLQDALDKLIATRQRLAGPSMAVNYGRA